MIGPRMATMLGLLIMTDAPLTPAEPRSRGSQEVVDDTFNCVSVEGHMSTNDTVVAPAWPTTRGEAIRSEGAGET